jgi:hypothetical protein
MNKLEALNYIIDNSDHSNEWVGAALYDSLSKIIKSKEEKFTKEYLDILIETAENN